VRNVAAATAKKRPTIIAGCSTASVTAYSDRARCPGRGNYSTNCDDVWRDTVSASVRHRGESANRSADHSAVGRGFKVNRPNSLSRSAKRQNQCMALADGAGHRRLTQLIQQTSLFAPNPRNSTDRKTEKRSEKTLPVACRIYRESFRYNKSYRDFVPVFTAVVRG